MPGRPAVPAAGHQPGGLLGWWQELVCPGSCPRGPGTVRGRKHEADFQEFGWKGQLGQPLDVTARSECRIKAQDEGVNSQKNKPWLTATCQYLHPIQMFVFMKVWAPTTISRPSSLARPSSNLISSAFTKD